MRGPLGVCLLLAASCSSPPTAAADTPAPAATDAASLRRWYSAPSSTWPAATIDPGVPFVELGPVQAAPRSKDPVDRARIDLGRMLFFDARLSGPGQMACASCHDAELGWADGRSTSFGHGFQKLRRNAPSILNAGRLTSLFWDGRAASLEDQALAVFENPGEMHASAEHVAATLRSSQGYRKLFAAAFDGAEPSTERAMTAIATFERTITSDGTSPFDRFLAGGQDELGDDAVRGLHLFRTKARCANCHFGPLLTDGSFHNLGLSYYGRELQDLGRYAVTKDPADVGRFKTPSLRNVERTAPYMHNGLFDLDGVLNMYVGGMPVPKATPAQKADPLFPVSDPLLQKLELAPGEKDDLRAFLLSLTERRRRVLPPELPPIGDVR